MVIVPFQNFCDIKKVTCKINQQIIYPNPRIKILLLYEWYMHDNWLTAKVWRIKLEVKIRHQQIIRANVKSNKSMAAI